MHTLLQCIDICVNAEYLNFCTTQESDKCVLRFAFPQTAKILACFPFGLVTSLNSKNISKQRITVVPKTCKHFMKAETAVDTQ